MLDVRPVLELLEQRQERTVDDHDAVVGVRRDVREIVRMQAEVQRVQHEAAARDAEVRLVMLVMVPAERRDARAALEAELLQRGGELLRAPHRLAVVRAVEALVGQARDDLAVAEERLGPLEDVRQRQREVHHQAVHGSLLGQTGTDTPSTASATSSRSSAGREPRPSSQSARL